MVYSSWLAMQKAHETDAATCAFNDFALVKLDPADYGRVNPTIPHWGGPTGVSHGGLPGFASTYSVGNSELRGGLGLLQPEGRVQPGRLRQRVEPLDLPDPPRHPRRLRLGPARQQRHGRGDPVDDRVRALSRPRTSSPTSTRPCSTPTTTASPSSSSCSGRWASTEPSCRWADFVSPTACLCNKGAPPPSHNPRCLALPVRSSAGGPAMLGG